MDTSSSGWQVVDDSRERARRWAAIQSLLGANIVPTAGEKTVRGCPLARSSARTGRSQAGPQPLPELGHHIDLGGVGIQRQRRLEVVMMHLHSWRKHNARARARSAGAVPRRRLRCEWEGHGGQAAHACQPRQPDTDAAQEQAARPRADRRCERHAGVLSRDCA